MVWAEKVWTEIEIREVGYVEEAQYFLVNIVTDDEMELFKPELVMAVAEAGHSTSMACRIMLLSFWGEIIILAWVRD